MVVVGRLGRIPATRLPPVMLGRKLGLNAAWMAEASGEKAVVASGRMLAMGLSAALAAEDRAPCKGSPVGACPVPCTGAALVLVTLLSELGFHRRHRFQMTM